METFCKTLGMQHRKKLLQ